MMNCTSCTKKFASEDLVVKQSRVLPIHIYVCEDCSKLGLEPRHIIVMKAREHGADSVYNYLIQRRYNGPEILLKEIL